MPQANAADIVVSCSVVTELLRMSDVSKHAVNGVALSTVFIWPDTAAVFVHWVGLTLRLVVDFLVGVVAGLLADSLTK
jgi:hypothetical protein